MKTREIGDDQVADYVVDSQVRRPGSDVIDAEVACIMRAAVDEEDLDDEDDFPRMLDDVLDNFADLSDRCGWAEAPPEPLKELKRLIRRFGPHFDARTLVELALEDCVGAEHWAEYYDDEPWYTVP